MSCHDFPLAFSVSDKIVILNNGEIADIGTPSEIAEKEILKNTLGISLIKNTDENLLYKYSLKGKGL